jgi:hypothetical protein
MNTGKMDEDELREYYKNISGSNNRSKKVKRSRSTEKKVRRSRGKISKEKTKKSPVKQIDTSLFINGFYGNQDLRNLSFWVSGLMSINVWYNPQINKIVYVLGETHSYENVCNKELDNMIQADEFFMILLNSSVNGNLINKDVFLENFYNPLLSRENRFESKELRPSFMTKVFTKLAVEGCISSTSDLCSYYKDNIRFHSTDIRFSNIDILEYIMMIRYIKDYHFYDENTMKIYINNVNNINSKFNDKKYYDYDSFAKEVKDALIATKVMKQIENIDPKYNNIKEYLIWIIDIIIRYNFKKFNVIELSKFLNEYNKYLTNGTPILRYDFENEFELLRKPLTLDLLFVDLYMIARIFRKFSHKLGSNKKHPQEPKNIIIYAGNDHCKFYNEIFEKFGFTKYYKFEPTDNKWCIKLKHMDIKWVCNSSELGECLVDIKKPVQYWNVKDVKNWIRNNKVFISTEDNTITKILTFIDNKEVDGKVLLNTYYKNLKDEGIPAGPAFKIDILIALLRNQTKVKE